MCLARVHPLADSCGLGAPYWQLLQGCLAASLDPKLRATIEAGIKAATAQLKEAAGKVTTSASCFGTPEKLRKYSDGYQRRAVAAMLGLYGNSIEEADYTPYLKDKDGKPISGKNRYTIQLNPPPPVKYFWSLTMVDLPRQLLVANPINRYKLSSVSEGLVKNSDGSVTLYIQYDAPMDPKQKANWLPAPEGNLFMVLRMYGPRSKSSTAAGSPRLSNWRSEQGLKTNRELAGRGNWESTKNVNSCPAS
jgi:hypothetical protein